MGEVVGRFLAVFGGLCLAGALIIATLTYWPL